MTLTATPTQPSCDQRGALLLITEALKPAKRADIEDALVRLGENVKPPFGSDPGLRLEEWTNFLIGYPGDVVFAALEEWPDTHLDWPQRAGIKPVLDALSLPRRRMLTAIQGMNAVEAEEELYVKTDADKAEVRRMHQEFLRKIGGPKPVAAAPHGKRAQIPVAPPPPSAFQRELAHRAECDALEAESVARERFRDMTQ